MFIIPFLKKQNSKSGGGADGTSRSSPVTTPGGGSKSLCFVTKPGAWFDQYFIWAGEGTPAIIPSGQLFAGRSEGGKARGQIFGTRTFASSTAVQTLTLRTNLPMSGTLPPRDNPLKLFLKGYLAGREEYKEALLFAIFEEEVKGIAKQVGALRLEGKPLLQFYCAEWNSYIRSADNVDELCKQNGKVYKLAILHWQTHVLIPLYGYILRALCSEGSRIDQLLVNTIVDSCPDSRYRSAIIDAWPVPVGRCRAAVWFLNTAVIDLYLPTTTTNATDLSEETVFDDDGRIPVEAVHFQDGGEFRSIVKVRVQFPNGQWYMGTGYLVTEGVVVTAAHNVCHETRGLAFQIECYIGYNGPQSVQAIGVQLRHGRKVVTMESWLNKRSPCHDVAFIQTDASFTGNLNPFEFIDTPSSITGLLGVVGYPSDKDLDGKKGAQMYKLFQQTTYDLWSSGIISYRTSTFEGQSGSPILLKTRNGKFVVIGTHDYGGKSTNFGSSIGGNSGNNYKALLKLAQKEEPQTAELMFVAL